MKIWKKHAFLTHAKCFEDLHPEICYIETCESQNLICVSRYASFQSQRYFKEKMGKLHLSLQPDLHIVSSIIPQKAQLDETMQVIVTPPFPIPHYRGNISSRIRVEISSFEQYLSEPMTSKKQFELSNLWLNDWLLAWLLACLLDWLLGWLVGWLVDLRPTL